MTIRKTAGAVTVLMALAVAGCMSPVSYVDPAYGRVAYGDLTRPAAPHKWRLTAEYRVNGTRSPNVDAEILMHVERIVKASGVAVHTTDLAAPELKVILNNFADQGQAVMRGVATGLTLGLIGDRVTDRYEMEMVLTAGEKVVRKSGYRHALHTTIGNASGPVGAAPMTMAAGIGMVMEQLMLNALKDLEGEYAASAANFCVGSPVAPRVWPGIAMMGWTAPAKASECQNEAA